jgi:hypothetical protein
VRITRLGIAWAQVDGIETPVAAETDLDPADAAERFWASPYGLRVRADTPLTTAVLLWLTASLDAGGMQASWHDPKGLRQVVAAIEAARP